MENVHTKIIMDNIHQKYLKRHLTSGVGARVVIVEETRKKQEWFIQVGPGLCSLKNGCTTEGKSSINF